MLDFMDRETKSFVFIFSGLLLFIMLLLGFGIASSKWDDITEWWNKADISVKGESGEKFHSYQAACEALDFAAAHQYVIKMEEASDKDRTIEEDDILDAKEYVFKKEVTYLLLDKGEDGEKRALYYLKELPEERIVGCASHLIDLAIMDKNSELAYNALDILINSIKRGDNNEETLVNIDEICDKLLDYAISNADKELANKILPLFNDSQNKKKAQRKYSDAVRSKVFK